MTQIKLENKKFTWEVSMMHHLQKDHTVYIVVENLILKKINTIIRPEPYYPIFEQVATVKKLWSH